MRRPPRRPPRLRARRNERSRSSWYAWRRGAATVTRRGAGAPASGDQHGRAQRDHEAIQRMSCHRRGEPCERTSRADRSGSRRRGRGWRRGPAAVVEQHVGEGGEVERPGTQEALSGRAVPASRRSHTARAEWAWPRHRSRSRAALLAPVAIDGDEVLLAVDDDPPWRRREAHEVLADPAAGAVRAIGSATRSQVLPRYEPNPVREHVRPAAPGWVGSRTWMP